MNLHFSGRHFSRCRKQTFFDLLPHGGREGAVTNLARRHFLFLAAGARALRGSVARPIAGLHCRIAGRVTYSLMRPHAAVTNVIQFTLRRDVLE